MSSALYISRGISQSMVTAIDILCQGQLCQVVKHQPHESEKLGERVVTISCAPHKTIICLRLMCSMKVSNENTLTFFCKLILHLAPVDLELIELVSTTYDGCCYY